MIIKNVLRLMGELLVRAYEINYVQDLLKKVEIHLGHIYLPKIVKRQDRKSFIIFF